MEITRPTTISATSGSFGAQFCRRRQLDTVGDLVETGLVPRVVDRAGLERAIDVVAKPDFYRAQAESRLAAELRQVPGKRSEAYLAARLEHHSRAVQAEGVLARLDNALPATLRRRVASRSVALLRVGSRTVTEFAIDEDLVVRADLTFDPSIRVLRAHDVRIAAGATMTSTGSYFVVHANSFRGRYRSAGDPGGDGTGGTKGTDGAAGGVGRAALCRDFLHQDQVPSNGGAGRAGAVGGSGSAGGDGSDGTPYEAHLQVLASGLIVDTSGGGGGRGGDGGTGGDGGIGGTGGAGGGCEPAGLGGPGGDGGAGGPAGSGGNGGIGGDITIYYVSDQSGTNPPVLTAGAGAAGKAGSEGAGGSGSAPGKTGTESKYGNATWDPLEAADGKVPGPGGTGATGAPGKPGKPGERRGDILVQVVPLV